MLHWVNAPGRIGETESFGRFLATESCRLLYSSGNDLIGPHSEPDFVPSVIVNYVRDPVFSLAVPGSVAVHRISCCLHDQLLFTRSVAVYRISCC